MLGRALGTSPQKQPPGQAGHVGQIRLSDWLKFEMLRSDWSSAKPLPFTTKERKNERTKDYPGIKNT